MRVLAVVVTLLVAATGCAAHEDATTQPSATATSRSSHPSASAAAGLVGEWKRLTTCQQRVQALSAAGLGQFAAEHAAGEGWLPGVHSPDQIKDKDHPCRGAVPLTHSHFFTDDGKFGSRDDAGDQVDDGTYLAVDDNTIVISKEFGDVTFHYRISSDGSTLLLDPVMPPCGKTGCFAAQWAVSVAYPGLPWHRSS
jgi:hypothetical protein